MTVLFVLLLINAFNVATSLNIDLLSLTSLRTSSNLTLYPSLKNKEAIKEFIVTSPSVLAAPNIFQKYPDLDLLILGYIEICEAII